MSKKYYKYISDFEYLNHEKKYGLFLDEYTNIRLRAY